MHITSFAAENFKRLTVVQITPEGALVQVTGKNGNGKTSVLDAIESTLAGAGAVPGQPIRKGKDKAKTRVVIQTPKGAITVERRYTAKNPTGTLYIFNEDGAEMKSPQSVLDAMMGAIAFDPLDFMRRKPKEQAATLRGVVKLEIDPDALDKERQAIFDERTTVGRLITAAQNRADGITLAPNLPDEAPDVDALVQELSEVAKLNADIDRLADSYRAQDETLYDARAAVEKLETMLKDAKEQVLRISDAVKERPAVPVKKYAGDIQAKISEARLTAEAIQQRDMKESAQAEVTTHTRTKDDLTAKIEAIDKKKADALASAQMPIEGLSFADGIVTYRDVPLDQASGAEQLRVSAAIGAALNPKLKVMLCRDGSLLDSDSLKLLAEFAESSGMQIFLERVEESGAVGIVMEDGHVKGQEELVAEFEKGEQEATEKAEKPDAAKPEAEPAPTEEETEKAVSWLATVMHEAAEITTETELETQSIRVKRILKRYPDMLRATWAPFYLERLKAVQAMRTNKP